MTKKDFEVIAHVLGNCYPTDPNEADPAYMEAWTLIASMFADVLRVHNPRFDRSRFLKACGME